MKTTLKFILENRDKLMKYGHILHHPKRVTILYEQYCGPGILKGKKKYAIDISVSTAEKYNLIKSY